MNFIYNASLPYRVELTCKTIQMMHASSVPDHLICLIKVQSCGSQDLSLGLEVEMSQDSVFNVSVFCLLVFGHKISVSKKPCLPIFVVC